MLAIVFNDYPEEWRLLGNCVYLSALSIISSWFLIRWKKKLVFTAIVLATGFGMIELLSFGEIRDWATTLSQIYDRAEARAVWFSAVFPYVMIALFYYSAKKEPNQPPEPTR